jgi:hypothetical protein
MSTTTQTRTDATQESAARRSHAEAWTWAATAALLLAGSLYPAPSTALLLETGSGLLSLLPVIALAALLAGAVSVHDTTDRVLGWIGHRTGRSVLIASAVGAITPVCGLGVLPLVAALLRRGLPLAPIMAFWVASPVTDPAMLAVTAGILGLPLAVAKTIAAFGIGLLAGALTAALPSFGGPGHRHMRASALADGGCAGGQTTVLREAWRNARLVARWLALALVLEVLVQRYVPEAWIAASVGGDTPLAVPLAAIVGAPLYLDGYAALPLVRGLLDLGMDPGAALALLVSGAAVSLYAIVAVAALVPARVIALYVALAMLGACFAGYGFQLALAWAG